MGIFQLSDGKKLRTPDGLTKKETAEWLFTNLEGKEKYAEDRARIGDKLETSGWGATIGGTLGGIAGGVAGIFTSPSVVVNPITLGATVGAGGAAIGEGIEQWITGKGDWSDIGWAGAEGGVYGAYPGIRPPEAYDLVPGTCFPVAGSIVFPSSSLNVFDWLSYLSLIHI